MKGMQHQPNVFNVDDMKKAQLEPDNYKDMIVRLWGVSARYIDLPKEMQDELISRLS
jgi:formate C-acetyltransferase